MTSPILRVLGALAGLGSATLCWFLGDTLAPAVREHKLFHMDGSHYALLAFLLVPALILAVVAITPRREPAPGLHLSRVHPLGEPPPPSEDLES